MKRYDDIVVGSGISGMTLALLLGLNGRSVLLLEKHRSIGGSIARFHKKGVPFDTGFHFTGGLSRGGILDDMLRVLGTREYIEPIFVTSKGGSQIVFEDDQEAYDLPTGYPAIAAKMKEHFPSEAAAVDRYLAMVRSVCERTAGMDLRNITHSPGLIDEDYVSLDEVLNKLTDNRALKGLMAGYSMCYGVKPAEVSFANHSRVSHGLYESVARVKRGGDAFVDAFRDRGRDLDIEVKTDCYITECADVQDRSIGRFVLSDGEEVTGDHCTFTIHPSEILKTLPREHLRKAFVNRVGEFEPSVGMFCVYGVVETEETLGSEVQEFGPSILSIFPTSDINALMDPKWNGDQALVIMRNLEHVGRSAHRVVNVCEISFVEHVAAWENSEFGDRPSDYLEYKERRVKRIRERVIEAYPDYANSFKVIDSATPLTFRDYLNSPDGSAYGVRQKKGQYNLFGKLPFRNLYAAGQSSLLPGLVGAMMSSFIVGRSLVGKHDYARFIAEGLEN